MNKSRIHLGTLTPSPNVARDGWVQRVIAWFRRSFLMQAPAQRRLKRVDTLALGPRKSVYLIECDGVRFLIADGLSAPVAFLAQSKETNQS